jgi:hypothetical protein
MIDSPGGDAELIGQELAAWVLGVTSNLVPRRSAALAALVVAAIHLEQVKLTAIGRAMAGEVADKHTTRWVRRFACNRVEVADAMASAIDAAITPAVHPSTGHDVG